MNTFASIVGLFALVVGGLTVLLGGWFVVTAGSNTYDQDDDHGRSPT